MRVRSLRGYHLLTSGSYSFFGGFVFFVSEPEDLCYRDYNTVVLFTESRDLFLNFLDKWYIYLQSKKWNITYLQCTSLIDRLFRRRGQASPTKTSCLAQSYVLPETEFIFMKNNTITIRIANPTFWFKKKSPQVGWKLTWYSRTRI